MSYRLFNILYPSEPVPIPKEKLHRLSIAPMMEVTNIHFRVFIRLLTRCSTLWTEMYHSNALIHGKALRAKQMYLFGNQYPVVCQLGGSEVETVRNASKMVALLGYDEVNLNCGCPSPRVQKGSFGACLMKERELVRDIIEQGLMEGFKEGLMKREELCLAQTNWCQELDHLKECVLT